MCGEYRLRTGEDALVEIHHDLARRLECAVLPPDRVAQVIAREVDAPFRSLQPVECRTAAAHLPGPDHPGAFAEARAAPVRGERRLELGSVHLAVHLHTLQQR